MVLLFPANPRDAFSLLHHRYHSIEDVEHRRDACWKRIEHQVDMTNSLELKEHQVDMTNSLELKEHQVDMTNSLELNRLSQLV